MNAATAVLQHIARAYLGEDSSQIVGAFRLRPAQREALRAAEAALEEFGGALIADAPGSGKTVLALALAARHADCLVLAPAALREQWQRAAARAGVAIRVASVESLSAGQAIASASLIVVDEAHQLRTPSTQRYRRLAQLAMHRRLLLLTATPVVNRLGDRDALLALILGERASELSAAQRARLILRLATEPTRKHPLHRLASLATRAEVPGLGEALQSLPPPLPLADGSAATAIVRTSLAFAWASSLAALDAALSRRLLRGRALDDQLAAGHWPSRASLRDFLVGDDAMQLTFGFETASAPGELVNARATLSVHLRAVAALRERIRPLVAADTAIRARALATLSAKHSGQRIVLLAQSAATVRALYSALRHEPGVVGIVGQRVLAAAGRWSRDEVLAALDARAGDYDPRDLRGIRLLLATDVLAEGVELQAASILVHGDPAWTPARVEQREGRLAREGQRREVLVTRFRVPAEAQALLRVNERLLRKAAARETAMRLPVARAQLARRLAHWRVASAHSSDGDSAARVAAIRHSHCGFLALLRNGTTISLVGGEYSRGRWRVTDSPRALARALPASTASSVPLEQQHLSCVKRVLRDWQRQRSGAHAARDESSIPASVFRDLRRRFDAFIAAAPLAERAERSRAAGTLLMELAALRGKGVEIELRRILRDATRDGTHEGTRDGTDDAALLGALRGLLAVAPRRDAASPGRVRIEALLILVAAPSARGASGPAPP